MYDVVMIFFCLLVYKMKSMQKEIKKRKLREMIVFASFSQIYIFISKIFRILVCNYKPIITEQIKGRYTVRIK